MADCNSEDMKFVRIVFHTAVIIILLFGSVLFIEIYNKKVRVPTMTNTTYKWDEQDTPKSYNYADLTPKEGGEYFELSWTMHIGKIRPLLWSINPDDCLEDLQINDIRVEHAGIPYCDTNNSNSIVLYLEPYMHTGANHVRIRIRHLSWGAGAWIAGADNDPFLLLIKLGVALAIFVYGLWLFSDLHKLPIKKKVSKST